MEEQNNKEQFVQGLDLSESYFAREVKPILDNTAKGLRYSAALIGPGSEVLGFDTEMSSDHCWGPRVMIFLNAGDFSSQKDAILASLSEQLPPSFAGYATKFSAPLSADSPSADTANYGIRICTIEGFFADYLNFDIARAASISDWLTFPEQKLATITAGRIFHDELGLNETRKRFTYYPEEIWLYLLACAWTRLEQEEHLMGRAGIAGDELGSALIASRLVRDLMRICFLMEKRYAPYPKWFGSAFAKLKAADTLEPVLGLVLSSSEWRERQRWLTQAYKMVARLHNQLGITERMRETPLQFHERPFLVISMGAFSQAIKQRISDPELKRIMERPLIGSIDLISDNTDLLSNAVWRNKLTALFEP